MEIREWQNAPAPACLPPVTTEMAERYLTPLDPAIAALVATLDENERETYEERAAQREFSGGFLRQTAEALAWQDVLELRQRRADSNSPPTSDSTSSP